MFESFPFLCLEYNFMWKWPKTEVLLLHGWEDEENASRLLLLFGQTFVIKIQWFGWLVYSIALKP